MRLRKAILRPETDVDGADILDYFLAEEEDAQRVDSLFDAPLSKEQQEVFEAIEDEVDEVEKNLPVSCAPLVIGQADDRTFTMNVYGPMKWQMCSKMFRKNTCSPSWKEGKMRK